MEEYRRVLKSTKVEEEKLLAGIRESIDAEKWLGLLKTGRVKEFNEIRQEYSCPLVHSFPYADLSGANLTGAYLFHSDLTGAKLLSVNLTTAILTKVNLTNANLTCAILRGTNLTHANLSGADKC